jgi:hypothetical protein
MPERKMEPRALRCFILAFLLGALSVSSVARRQEQTSLPAPPARPAETDRFVGAWKLNTEKTTHSGIQSEMITIESQGNDFKLTFDWLAENGTELHWWYVTDMKGGSVKATQVNGRPMSGEVRFTRLNSSAFREESVVLRDEYKVSGDGQTLRIHRTFLMNTAPHKLPKDVLLVFDRVH